MKQISSDILKEAINEAINEMFGEAGMPFKPVGAQKPVAKPGGGMPFKAVGAAKPVQTPAQQPAAQTPAATPAAPTAPAAAGTDTSGDDGSTEGGSANGKYYPGIFSSKYEPFYETKDPAQVDKEVLKIWLVYINNQAVQAFISMLNKDFGDIIFAPMPNVDQTCRIPKNFTKKNGKPLESGFNSYFVKMIVRPGKNDEFVKAVPSIVDGLYQIFDDKFSSKPRRGRPFQGNQGAISYDDTFKPKFEQYLIDTVSKTASPEDIKIMNVKIAQSVKELLTHLKDPEVQKRLGQVRVILNGPARQQRGKAIKQSMDVTGDDGLNAGWLLSARNAAYVVAQDPSATYIAQEHTWRQWGHEVIDPNDYILVNMPTSWKNYDEKAFDRACKAFGFAGGADDYRYAKKNKNVNLSKQQYYALMHLSNLFNPNATEFGYRKFYDVRNTRVVQGQNSEFLPGPDQTVGLSNNIYGIVNQAASASKAGMTPGGIANATPDVSTAPSTSMNPEEVELFRDALADVVRSVTQSAPNGTGNSAEDDIVKYAYFYAQYLVNTVFTDLVGDAEDLCKKGFTAAVAASVGITDQTAADYLSQALSNRGKDSKIEQLAPAWYREYVDLLTDTQKEMEKIARSKSGNKKKVAVEESIGGNGGIKVMGIDQFKKLLGVGNEGQYEVQNDVATQQELQEAFFSFLDKMDRNDR